MNFFWTKKSLYLLLVFSILSASCKTAYTLKNTDRTNQRITKDVQENKEYVDIIQPYKTMLDAEMKKVISLSEQEYTRSGSTTSLGNLLADLLYDEAKMYCNEHNLKTVDFVLLNHGGMRRNLFKGAVTVGDVYEISPFENEMVIVEISGANMKELISYFAIEKKGHPISNLTLFYKNGIAETAKIGEQFFDENKTYRLVTNDYLQKGGDNMTFLKDPIQITETHLKLRDIFIKQIAKHPILPHNSESRLKFED